MQQVIATDRSGAQWFRVSKRAAFNAWQAGKVVTLCPCKMYPFGHWNIGIEFDPALNENPFVDIVRNFEWYNCNYETGYYSAYYLKTKGA